MKPKAWTGSKALLASSPPRPMPRAVVRADLREGGRWTLVQRAKNDALWALASVILRALRPWSLPALRALGRVLGETAFVFVRSARRTATGNLACAMPDADPRVRRALARRCFATLGESLADTVALLAGRDPPKALVLTDEARATLERARAEGRGVLFASAHLGPWENVAASLVAGGFPLVTLARESYDPRFSVLYDRLRRRTGVAVIWRADRRSAFAILRTLRRGGVLGVPMDLRSRVPSIAAPFLGRPAETAVGPARIALRSGAAVVVGTAAPAGGAGGTEANAMAPRGSALATLVVTATRVETADLSADEIGVAALTARINDELSRRILALPHAWVWMHPRWE
jgi:KDO2-lipid IV(A) lauroyltransferase